MTTKQFNTSSSGILLLVCLAMSGLATSCERVSSSPSTSLGQKKLTISAKAKQLEAIILRDELAKESDLSGLPLEELRILRNAVFAKHGRPYQRQGLGEYFYYCDWYKPNPAYKDDNANNLLTAADKQNVKTFLWLEEVASQTNSSSVFVPEKPMENQVKNDLLGRKLLVGSDWVWSFDGLTEFESFSIENLQQAGGIIEMIVTSRLIDRRNGAKYSASYICTYNFTNGGWNLASVNGTNFARLDVGNQPNLGDYAPYPAIPSGPQRDSSLDDDIDGDGYTDGPGPPVHTIDDPD